MSNTFFEGDKNQCPSTFVSLDGQHLRCIFPRNHDRKHKSKPFEGPFITWTDAELKEARKKNRPVLTGPIEVWRGWMLGSEARLASISANVLWDSPLMTVKKKLDGSLREVRFKNDFDVTDEEDYGVFSYKNPNAMLKYLGSLEIYGRCHISGQAVEHEIGWRSQKLTVQELWVVIEDQFDPSNQYWANLNKIRQDAIPELSKRYDCEVHAFPKSKLKSWADYFTKEIERRQENVSD